MSLPEAIKRYIEEDYELLLEGDASHQPSEFESFMLEDFASGLISDEEFTKAFKATTHEAELLRALEQLLENTEIPPDRNCSCHISPPCGDCVDFSSIRGAIEDAKAAIAKARGLEK